MANLRYIPIVLFSFIFIHRTYAVCPVCTIAAVSCLGISHYLGIDDTVTGLWIGGLLLSTSLWFNAILRKKQIRFPFKKYIIIVTFYGLTILPLYWYHMIGLPGNSLWNVDKLLLGILIGSTLFLLGIFCDLILRASNDCKVYFYFQKTVIPISLLIVASMIFYFLTV